MTLQPKRKYRSLLIEILAGFRMRSPLIFLNKTYPNAKIVTILLLGLHSLAGYTQSLNSKAYWNLSLDSITSLRQKDSLYIITSIKAFNKDSNLIKASEIFDEIYDSDMRGYKAYLNANTCIKIYEKITSVFELTKEESFTVFIREGFCKYLIKKNHEAITDLNYAIKANPLNGYTYWFKGLCKQSLDDNYGAISDFSESLQHANSDSSLITNVYLSIAQSQKSLGKYTFAVFAYDKVIEMHPEIGSLYLERGKLKMLNFQIESACLDFSKAGELGCLDAYPLISQYCK